MSGTHQTKCAGTPAPPIPRGHSRRVKTVPVYTLGYDLWDICSAKSKTVAQKGIVCIEKRDPIIFFNVPLLYGISQDGH